jgi:hypothetical protein
MGKIVVTTNISLDGVVQDPDGQVGSSHGGWFGQFGGKDLEGWAKVETDEALHSEAILLGHKSDEWFACAIRALRRSDRGRVSPAPGDFGASVARSRPSGFVTW